MAGWVRLAGGRQWRQAARRRPDLRGWYLVVGPLEARSFYDWALGRMVLELGAGARWRLRISRV